MERDSDLVSRAELASIIRAAGELETVRDSRDLLDLAEAERIAEEVGIRPADFRAAVRAIRDRRRPARQFLGPPGLLIAGETLPRAMAEEAARELLLEGQRSFPIPGGAFRASRGRFWRFGTDGKTELQVTAQSDRTRVTAFADRRPTRLGLLAGGTLAGGAVGSVVLSGVAFAAMGTPEALALSTLGGLLGGATAGFFGGRAAWRALARCVLGQLRGAVDRMYDAGTE